MSRVAIDVHFHAEDLRSTLESDVLKGLTSTPKELPPKWFYDDRGSELFDEITRLPEYYPTEAERSILHEQAHALAVASGADTLVELGSGTSDKTRVLLDAMAETRQLRRYVPVDCSEATLRYSAAALAERYPDLEIHGVVGDFERHLAHVPGGGRRMLAFLGGTIGNFTPAARTELLGEVASTLASGDTFLLGTDLVKDAGRLVRAYDDRAGVTAAFNKNVLTVINRELHADFEPDQFEHVARWNEHDEWIEMWLRSTVGQRVRIDDLDLDVSFAAGEELRTEISAKFRRPGITAELAAAGLTVEHWCLDTAGDYALSLSRR
jgi:L-histidine N-alpha-methyltransferase